VKRHFSLPETIVVALVLVLSLALRLTGLEVFVVHDEMRWACRSIRFRAALADGDWAETYQVGHPGVMTMWLGTISITRGGAEAGAACEAFDDYRHFDSDDLPATTKDELAEVGRMLFEGRVGVALFTWLCTIASYVLIRSLFGPMVGVLSLILVALDPFSLALSRVFHTDAVLTSLMTLSVLSILASWRHQAMSRRGVALLMASGASGGLAVAQKSPAGFLVPFVILVLAFNLMRRGARRKTLSETLRALILWGLSAAIVYVGVWPAMWSDPVGTVTRILSTATRYAAEGHTPGNYFLGNPVHDPGWLFYPVAALFRLSPVTLVGLMISWVPFTAKGFRGKQRFFLTALSSYSLLFALFMSLGDKMFDRYLLPVFPALCILAANGLLWAAKRVSSWVQHTYKPSEVSKLPAGCVIVLISLALVVQLGLLLPHHPYYFTYYNPLLGGPKQARNTLLVGWGEGYDQAADWLNAKPNAEELHVTAPTTAAFAPLFRGETWPMDRFFEWQSDYLIFYISEVQRRQQEELLEEYVLNPRQEPECVVSMHGIDYAWVYHNDDYEEPSQYIKQHTQLDRGQCLLVRGQSLFAKHYDGDLPLQTFTPQYDPQDRSYTYGDRDEMSLFLDEISTNCSEVWFPRYPDEETERYIDLLEARATLLDETRFSRTALTLHQLVDLEAASLASDLRFGNLRLLNYGITAPPPAWGTDGGLVLAWEAVKPVQGDYSVYIHLYDAHGHRLAQGDSLIVDRSLDPTSAWETGVAKTALYHLPIPPGTPPGRYRLELGVYQVETGERLPRLDSEAIPDQTAARLEMVVGRPDQPPEMDELNIPHTVRVPLTRHLELVGYELENESTQHPEGIVAGEPMGVRLFWQAHGSMDQDYRLQLTLRGDDDIIYGKQTSDLTSTDYPTTRWQPDELLGEWYYLRTRDDVPTGEAILELDVLDSDGHPVLTRPSKILDMWIQSTAPSFNVPSDVHTHAKVNLGDQITLLGHEMARTGVQGGTIAVTLYWKAERDIDAGYKVFAHLYDGEGGILAQRDRVPGLGTRPTSTWRTDEVVADRYHIEIPTDAPAGQYQIGVGMYDPQSEQRLRAHASDGERLAQDSIILGTIEIGP